MTVSERVGRTRVGAYAICTDGDRLLLCRVAPRVMGAGIWTLPGGEVEFGEDPAEAVLRELAEETGLAGHVGGLLEVSSRLYRPDDVAPPPVHAIRVIYRVAIIGGELRDEPDGSTDRAAWLGPQDRRTLPMGDLVELGERIAFG